MQSSSINTNRIGNIIDVDVHYPLGPKIQWFFIEDISFRSHKVPTKGFRDMAQDSQYHGCTI